MLFTILLGIVMVLCIRPLLHIIAKMWDAWRDSRKRGR